MTEREEALEPCPFCGGEASRQDLTDDDNAGGSCIACDSCGASSPVHFDRKENLYDSWNRRASSPPPKGGEPKAASEHLSSENARLREALGSIARNTCCDPCREAALVARAALSERTD